MTKQRIDVMVDIETLSTKSNATIFQIAALAFEIETGNVIRQFNHVADIEKNKLPLVVDGSTLKWWLRTDKQLLHDSLHRGELSSEDVLFIFHHWLDKLNAEYDVYLWGNGILFDNKLIQHQFELNNMSYPIHYKNDRDVRTIVELASQKLGISEGDLKARFDSTALKAHDAFDDVVYQIALVCGCYKILMEGGGVDDN